MTSVFKLPLLGETMESGKVAQWLKQPGQSFRRGETIVEVETDKTTVEVPALSDGTIVEILAETGKELKVGEPLCVIRSDTPLELPSGSAVAQSEVEAPPPAEATRPEAIEPPPSRSDDRRIRARRESTSPRSSAPGGAGASRFATSSCTPKRRKRRPGA